MGKVLQFPSGKVVEQYAAEAQETREKLAAVEPERQEDPRLRDFGGQYNYAVGKKYTPGMSTKDIAATLRAEVKAAIAKGDLPKGLKVSVRYRSFSGGSSIDLRVTAVPAGFVIKNPERVKHDLRTHYAYTPDFHCPIFTPEATALKDKLQGMMNAWNYDRSDIQTDYFDVKFYGHAEFSYDLTNAEEEAIKAQFAAEKAAAAT